VPKQFKEANVPRKCNVLIIINNKYIIGYYMDKEKSYRGYDSTREGD
jgi:hypothetical protein